MAEWISVKDRLPENWQEVLIYCGNGYVEQVTYEHHDGCDDIWIDQYSEFHEPDYWMPLPEPPKEDE